MIQISNVAEFNDALCQGINKSVNKSYKKNSADEKELLKALFYWKWMADAMSLYESMNKGKEINAASEVVGCYYEFIKESIDDATYPSWDEAMKEQNESVMTYCCYEDWNWIVSNAVSSVEGSTPEMFGKLVQQLYS